MKKLLTILCLAFSLLLSNHVSAGISAPADENKEAVVNKPTITIEDIKTLSPKEIEEKIGQKLNWKQKLAIKLTKNRLAKAENADRRPAGDGSFGLGFLLGFVLGLIGVLIAYIAFKGEKKTIKGSWFGLLAVVLLVILLTAVFAASVV